MISDDADFDDTSDPQHPWWRPYAARLTGKTQASDGTWLYDSVELIAEAGSAEYDEEPQARRTCSDPADCGAILREINDREIDLTWRPIVRVWYRGTSAEGAICWEFDGRGSVVTFDRIRCIDWVRQILQVERTTVDLLTGVEATQCLTNPCDEDSGSGPHCGEVVTVLPCCPDGLPSVLCLTVTPGEGGTCSGTFTLTFNGLGWFSGQYPYPDDPFGRTFEWQLLICTNGQGGVVTTRLYLQALGATVSYQDGGSCVLPFSFPAFVGTNAVLDCDPDGPIADVIITAGECASSDTTFDCTECPDGAPLQWTTTIAGFGGDCAVFNGDWTLTYTSDCTWVATSGSATLTLTRNSTGYTLTLTDPPGITGLSVNYIGNPSGCCDEVELPLDQADPCDTYPASITITPVGDCSGGGGGGGDTGTDCCPDGLASTLHLTLSGGTSGADCLDGTYALAWDGAEWIYEGTVCGVTVRLVFFCFGGVWVITATCDGGTLLDGSDQVPGTCSLPLAFGTLNLQNGTPCASSGATIIATVTS